MQQVILQPIKPFICGVCGASLPTSNDAQVPCYYLPLPFVLRYFHHGYVQKDLISAFLALICSQNLLY